MYKNIIHITGTDSYGVELELERWLGVFRGKFGDINIDRYDLGDKESMWGVGEMILMSGLFAEKRLFIFRGGRDRKSKIEGFEKILIEKVDTIPDDHYLLFHTIGAKEEGLITWLQKNADTRRINTLWDENIWATRFGLSDEYIRVILETYQQAESIRNIGDGNSLLGHTIAHTMERASLMEMGGQKISRDTIIGLCHGYGGDSMFALADSIIGMNIGLAINIVKRLASETKVDDWMSGLIGTLRNTLYIKYLKEYGSNETDIAKILQKQVYKGYKSPITYQNLKTIYIKLVEISIAYKRGKGLKDSELGRIMAIELALLDLQNKKNI